MGDIKTFPPIIGPSHLVALGIADNEDAARRAARRWPPELRVTGLGRKAAWVRDRVLVHLGLGGQGEAHS